VVDLAARYHHDDGRPYRLLVAAHPVPAAEPAVESATATPDTPRPSTDASQPSHTNQSHPNVEFIDIEPEETP
jgi:hypothetical protein